MRYVIKVGTVSPSIPLAQILNTRNADTSVKPVNVPAWTEGMTVQFVTLNRWDVLSCQDDVRSYADKVLQETDEGNSSGAQMYSERLHEAQRRLVLKAVHAVSGIQGPDGAMDLSADVLEADHELMSVLFTAAFHWNTLDAESKKQFG